MLAQKNRESALKHDNRAHPKFQVSQGENVLISANFGQGRKRPLQSWQAGHVGAHIAKIAHQPCTPIQSWQAMHVGPHM